LEDFIQNKFGYCFYEITDTALIYNLYVHPEYRNCGNAKILLQHVINEIRAIGYIGVIKIGVDPREPEIDPRKLTSFYTKLGLKII